MPIEELIAVVQPPIHPVETGDFAKWEAVQRALGLSLPSDFRDFGIRYGTGCFDPE